jgi:hypothetical protein
MQLSELDKDIEQKTPPLKKRQAGLGRGTVWISDDFDDELPDSFFDFERDKSLCREIDL